MRYLELGLAFASVGFVVANLALSLLTVLLWRVLRSSKHRAGSLLAMRMLPAIGSAGFMLGLVVPAFWMFEPRTTAETVGPVLVAFVLIAVVLVAAGLYRTVVAWLETWRLERRWKSAAVGSVCLEFPARTYRVPTELPLAALVGVVRPRLFVSDRFFDALSAGERQAVAEHEAGHLRSLDNLKRIAMRLAPDWLFLSSAGREIESAWAVAAEEAADDHASGPDRSRSLDLAGALLKASRLAPMRGAAVSNFCDESTIVRRVARLLKDEPTGRDRTSATVPRLARILALLGVAALFSGHALSAAYAMTEAAVRLLQ